MTHRPTSLYTIPTSGPQDADFEEGISISGFNSPPPDGSICLVVPSSEGDQLRLVDKLFRVTGSNETGDRDWPWDLSLEAISVPKPQTWFDLTTHLMAEGLKTFTGVYGEGDRVTDPATIDEVFRFLGF